MPVAYVPLLTQAAGVLMLLMRLITTGPPLGKAKEDPAVTLDQWLSQQAAKARPDTGIKGMDLGGYARGPFDKNGQPIIGDPGGGPS